MKKILMVCLGNICRSPVAQGILEHQLQNEGIEAEVDSAGTSGWHDGEAPDPRSQESTRKNGIEIAAQKSRKVVLSDFEYFDVIYAMDENNYSNLLDMAPDEHIHKVKMILNESYPNENLSVPDPYYNTDGFGEVFTLLNDACKVIVEKLKK